MELEEQGATFENDGSIVFPASEQETIVEDDNDGSEETILDETVPEEEDEMTENESNGSWIFDKWFKR